MAAAAAGAQHSGCQRASELWADEAAFKFEPEDPPSEPPAGPNPRPLSCQCLFACQRPPFCWIAVSRRLVGTRTFDAFARVPRSPARPDPTRPRSCDVPVTAGGTTLAGLKPGDSEKNRELKFKLPQLECQRPPASALESSSSRSGYSGR